MDEYRYAINHHSMTLGPVTDRVKRWVVGEAEVSAGSARVRADRKKEFLRGGPHQIAVAFVSLHFTFTPQHLQGKEISAFPIPSSLSLGFSPCILRIIIDALTFPIRR